MNFKKFKIKQLDVNEIDERTLLLNLYLTQLITLFIGIVILFFQRQEIIHLFSWQSPYRYLEFGVGFALIVIIMNMILSHWIPEEVSDDGGINDKIFQNRSILHIILMTFIIALCEEILFRGAIQAVWGAYWTSVFFAAIHVRYLRHWLMTGLVFAISYGMGLIYIWTGSLWTPILAHFVIDLVMGLILRFRKD